MNILLTSCISPSPDLRKAHHNDYFRLLDLLYNIKVILADLTSLGISDSSRIEIVDNSSGPNSHQLISLLQNFCDNFDVPISVNHFAPDFSSLALGKGYQEFLMLSRSELVLSGSSFIKLSGRYCFSNFYDILKYCINNNSIICTHDLLKKLTLSSIFYVPKYVSSDLFSSTYFYRIDDNNCYYFEHALFSSLRSYDTLPFLPSPSLIETFRTGEHNLSVNRISIPKKVFISIYHSISDLHPRILRNAL